MDDWLSVLRQKAFHLQLGRNRKDEDMNTEEHFAEFDAVMARIYGRDLARDWEVSRMADAEMGDL